MNVSREEFCKNLSKAIEDRKMRKEREKIESDRRYREYNEYISDLAAKNKKNRTRIYMKNQFTQV